MNFIESSPSLTKHNVTIVTRLRGPMAPENEKKFFQKKNPKEKQVSKSINKNNNTKSNSNSRNKQIPNGDSKSRKNKNNPAQSNNNLKKGLTENISYTMFTSTQPCNLMLVSTKPIEGATINQAFQNKSNLYEFGKNFLKESALFEFDKIYNESHSIDLIYKDLIKENISNLFQKKNSSIIFYGPIDAGKSFLVRGGKTDTGVEPGLLVRGVRDVFRLISLYNQANNDKPYFFVLFSSYQIYLDNIHDLLTTENDNSLTIEKYLENNILNTNIFGLTEREIKNISEYESCMREALHNRATLSQKLKTNDINRKSSFIFSIRLQRRMNNKIENYSKIDFVELPSSNFGQTEIPENDLSPKVMLYKNINNTFNSLCENIVCSCDYSMPNNDCTLTLALKSTLNQLSNIVFINCVVPWEFPLGHSYKSIKFTNWLRNMVINQNEKQNQSINLNANKIHEIDNEKNLKINIDVNDSDNTNTNISNINLSYEKLASNQRNSAYGNNYEPQKNISLIDNKNNIRTNNFKKEEEKNYYNLNTYQNQNKKNKINSQISSINNHNHNHNLTYDYEEQIGNLSMLNNNTALLNMNNTDIYNNTGKTNESSFIPYNDMNLSLNLPNKEKNATNLQNYMTQFPRKEEPQNINLMTYINPTRNNRVINERDVMNEHSESEIKSLREKARKKYQSSSIERNSHNYSQNITAPSLEQAPNNNYERIQTQAYQRINDNNLNNTNSTIIHNNNNNLHNNLNTKGEINDVSRIMNPQELKIKELEDKVRLLEEKSFQNTQKLEEIRINKESNNKNINNINMNGNANYNNLSNLNNLNATNNHINDMNMTTVSYLPDAEIEKIKQEANTIKSDNIIFREDINRLTDINHHLENELIEQRNRNIELANENEQICQEKMKLEMELKEAKEIIDKNKLGEKNLESFFNEKLMMQNKMRDNENDLRKAMEEKNKYEIDFKVLQEKFCELNDKYSKINEEYSTSKKTHDEEVSKIESKIDKLMREIERLQNENNGLRQDNERQRIEISSLGSQRDSYREKYEEQKNKNDLLSGKIADIENDFRNLLKEKDFQNMNRYKQDEYKRNKSETKAKIINELQARIQNYRNQRMIKKRDEYEEDQY